MRLVDSNEQSARYAKDIEKLIKLAKEQNEVSRAVTETLTTIQKRLENDFFFKIIRRLINTFCQSHIKASLIIKLEGQPSCRFLKIANC